jgi:hypothetical protein
MVLSMSDLDTLLHVHDGLEGLAEQLGQSILYEKSHDHVANDNKPPKRVGLWRRLWLWTQKPRTDWRGSKAQGHHHASAGSLAVSREASLKVRVRADPRASVSL